MRRDPHIKDEIQIEGWISRDKGYPLPQRCDPAFRKGWNERDQMNGVDEPVRATVVVKVI